jgi:hypothetical protein
VQTVDSITPGNPHYSEKSRLAKTMRRDGASWGDIPKDESQLAHANSSMTCYACHTSWTPNCFGCHLSMTADEKRPMLHNEGLTTRNWTAYNFQVLRDDGYMLAVDGTVTGHRVAPARSSCAILVSSQNANREWLYNTQQTVSAEGFSGTSPPRATTMPGCRCFSCREQTFLTSWGVMCTSPPAKRGLRPL